MSARRGALWVAALLCGAAAAAPTELERGKALFIERCVACHGERGAGDGPAAQALVPHPADLTAARMSAEHLDATLWNGVPGTAMPSQRDLSALDRKALAAFVRSLGPAQPPAPAAAATVALGRDLFAIRCGSCHGEAADGTGPARARFARPPADFSRKQPTRARIEQVLTHGIPGTAMTPMRRLLSDTELAALVAYVQSVYGRNLSTGKDEAAAP